LNDLILTVKDGGVRNAAQALFTHLNFNIHAGEHWAFTGENETLLAAFFEAIAGTRPFVKGQVQYFFKDANNDGGIAPYPQKKIQAVSFRHSFRNLANTSQFYYQQRFNSADAENALSVDQYLTSIPVDTSNPVWTFEKVVAALKLQPLLHETLIKLSNGETKRVLLAAALLRNPVLLLLNHLFAGLDAASRIELGYLLQTIAASGTTLVLATGATTIPDVITHVAQFNMDGTITCFSKTGFHPNHTTTPLPQLDEEALKALLVPQARFQEVISMKAVTIRYGNAVILDNINWRVKQGERWALRGPNGSGKSTLLSLINGDNPQAFANHIILFDRRKGSGESIWDIKKNIGFFSPELFQYFPVETSCLHAVESGFYDTVGLFRPSHPTTAGLALRWMALFGIEALATKALHAILPQQQRLCLLARALVKSPPLLLLDEPCQGFSEMEQRRFKQIINAVCRWSNTTLVYVSHYDEELPDCITKTITLLRGKQVAP
ncbi:MAG TPA: ATP-binding cassette domain-containing protein, partial [Chitinophagaceae bacterium]|nr:ATP-binding cassette domain-containing protein [Chitinophagaceae bacterium]